MNVSNRKKSVSSKRRNFSTFSNILLALFLGAIPGPKLWSDATEKGMGWYRDDGMVMLYQAVTTLSRHSLYIDDTSRIGRSMLETYIHTIDPYGEYLDKDTFEAYKALQNPEYAGIGILLYSPRDKDGIYCRIVDETIRDAGIKEGDRILAIDGRSVEGIHFYRVASMIRGQENSKVTLTVEHPDGRKEHVTLQRRHRYGSSVTLGSCEGRKCLKIVRFTRDTPSEILRYLRKFKKHGTIVIDLRDNEGGDLQAGIRSAELFLKKGATIATLQSRDGNVTYISKNGDYAAGKKVLLLQNHRTASAAELFIGTLVQNGRAQSEGERTFGKGVAQRFYPLSDGGALLLTYAKILLPNKKCYDMKGLEPILEK